VTPRGHVYHGTGGSSPWRGSLLEEVVVPCWGRKLEAAIFPAVGAALFRRDLEPLGALVRQSVEEVPSIREEAEKDWGQLRADVLHGQIDYRGEGPLPEHWKQFIDKEANLFDWRHPKWVMDAERLIVDLAVKAAAQEGWVGEIRPTTKASAGLIELLMEMGEAVPAAKPFADKFLEGMPEWLQHDNAYTGGYLTEEDVVKLLDALAPSEHDFESSLKAGALAPGWIDALRRAQAANVGLTWTVPMLRA
jgi:hypothetical protein